MQPLDLGWLALAIFASMLGVAFSYLSMINKNKKMLIFGISFIISSICYILIAFELTQRLYSIYQWTGFPIMIAILFCTIEEIFKVRSFDRIFNMFLIIISILLPLFLFMPTNLLSKTYFIRFPLASLIILMIIYLLILNKRLTNFLFLFTIMCFTIAGISISRGDSTLSLYSYFIGYIFLSMISFSEQGGEPGLDKFLNLRRELDLARKKLLDVMNEQYVILENIPAMIYLKDEKGRFIRFNRAFYEFLRNGLDMKHGDILGKRAEDIFPRDYQNMFYEDDDVIKTGRAKMGLLKGFTIDNKSVWLKMDKIPYREHGRRGLICIANDVTEDMDKERLLRESRERFRILAETAPFGIIVIQKEAVVYVNKAMEHITGYSKGELFRMRFWEIAHPDYKDIVKERGLRRQKGEYIPPYECKIITRDGKERWARVTGDRIIWNGLPASIVAVVDITDLKELQENIKESENRFRALAESSPIDILIIQDGKFVYTNFEKGRVTRYSRKDILSKNFIDLVHPEFKKEMENKYLEVLSGKDVPPVECKIIDKNGKERWVLIGGSLIIWNNKPSVLITVSDITDRKRAEERLRVANELLKERKRELERLNRLKSAFLNITSHELRTPMAAIRGYAQLLMLGMIGEVDDEQKKVLETIIRNIDRLNKLINDILDVSRLESGTLKIAPEVCRLEKIIDESIETMDGYARLKNIKIERSIGYDLPDLLLDKYRMEQVMTNLISNAIKFSGRNSKIIVKAERRGNKVILEVQDFGRGIPEDKLSKIFEPFYQVDSGMDRKFGGAGLGLTIVKGIVEAHGGKIEVESKVGEGSTFRIILPLHYIEKERKVKIFSKE